jgi:hypothetical protein
MKQTVAWMLLASMSISVSVQPKNFIYSGDADSDSCLIAEMQNGRPDSIIQSPVMLDINYRKIIINN